MANNRKVQKNLLELQKVSFSSCGLDCKKLKCQPGQGHPCTSTATDSECMVLGRTQNYILKKTTLISHDIPIFEVWCTLE